MELPSIRAGRTPIQTFSRSHSPRAIVDRAVRGLNFPTNFNYPAQFRAIRASRDISIFDWSKLGLSAKRRPTEPVSPKPASHKGNHTI